MMKKLLTVISIIALISSVGCGKNNETPTQTPASIQASVDNSVLLATLTPIEQKDHSNVKVLSTEIQKNAINDESSSGKDAFILKFENNGDEDVVKVNFYVTGVSTDGTWTKIQSNSTLEGETSNAQAFVSKSDFVLPAGGTNTIAIACDSTRFSDTKSIVYSYTTADGTEYVNDVAGEWLNIVTK